MTDAPLSRHDLYERCVQSPRQLAPLLAAIHGENPRTLGEDFAGTAALSIQWARPDDRAAIAADLDPVALAHHPDHPRVTRRHADVLETHDPCDLLFAGNFSIGYLRTRAELLAYLRHARARLNPGGAFVCDIYGGETAFLTGEVERDHPITDGPHAGAHVRYTWAQREADPITGMVTNTCSFRVERDGAAVQEMPDAFVYRWRLWSVPELRDAMAEAGFGSTEVYDHHPDAVDDEGLAYAEPVTDPDDLDDSFIVLIAARR